MATIISQRIENSAKKLLSLLGIAIEQFKPAIVAEIPVKATGLLAGIDACIEFDAYSNPFAVTENNERVSLVVAITYQDKVFVYNREGKALQNANTGIDVIGAVGFGISSLFHKIPAELAYKQVAGIHFSNFMAVEETDGQGDKAVVKMPIVLVEVAEIQGLEEHFIEVSSITEGQTAKLQATISAIQAMKPNKH